MIDTDTDSGINYDRLLIMFLLLENEILMTTVFVLLLIVGNFECLLNYISALLHVNSYRSTRNQQ